jgi:hypothetical protein
MSQTSLGIVSPDAQSVLVPLHSHFNTLASTVNQAITDRFQVKHLRYESTTTRDDDYTEATGIPKTANSTQPNLQDGDMCIVNLDKRQFIWNVDAGVGKWLAIAKRFTFTNTSARDAVLDADLYAGDTCYVEDIKVEYYWDGSAWKDQDLSGAEWSTWTPTVSGWTGATVNYARYKQYGKTIHYQIKITGSTTAPSTFTFTPPLPGNATSTEVDTIGGSGLLRMGSLYQVTNIWTGANILRPGFVVSAAAAVNYFSSTVPVAYASGAIIRISGTYEAA